MTESTGENLLQTVPRIAYTNPTSNSVESDSGTVNTLDIRPPPYTAPEKEKKSDIVECMAMGSCKEGRVRGSAYG